MRASVIINKAKSYLGLTEFPADSNNVIFNTDYYGYAVYGSAYPWCMAFVWDIFRMCEASDLFYDGNRTASCPCLMDWAQKKGQFVTGSYQPGDVLFFNFHGSNDPAHTGFAISDNGSTVTTVEGNTSSDNSGDQTNGGGVFQRTRDKSVIIGAYRPKYDSEIESGWKQDSKGWWYVKPDGDYYKSEWAKIDKKWYYFWDTGYMASTEYIKSSDYQTNGYLYYVDDKGAWNNSTYTWKQDNVGYWIENIKTKAYPKKAWRKIDGKQYYFNEKGYMVTDTWVDNTHYVGKDGALVEGMKKTKTKTEKTSTILTKEYKVKITAKNGVNVRKEPGISSPIVAVIKKGEICTIVEEQGDWGKTKSNKGWIMLKYTEKV